MSKQNKGGRAFPRTTAAGPGYGGVLDGHDGMSTRDYFAAKAMPQIMEQETRHCPVSRENDFIIWQAEIALDNAHTAYRVADAMLKARAS